MKILIIKENEEIRSILTFFLESQYDGVIKEVCTSQEAIEALLEEAEFDLVICEDNEKSTKLFKYLLSIDSTIPCILLTKPGMRAVLAFPDLIIGSASLSHLVDELKVLIDNAIQSGRLRKELEDIAYSKIQTGLLTRVAPLKADVFIRLSRTKFVKLFREGDVFDKDDLEKYLIKRKINHLYLKQDGAQEFLNKFKEDVAKLISSASLTEESANVAAQNVHETVQEVSKLIGFTQEVQDLAKQGVELTMKAINGRPEMRKILKILDLEKEKYVASHSIFLAHIACCLATAMKWPSGPTYQKLVYAAYFHDIVFTNQELARVGDLGEIEKNKGKFSDDDIAFYKDHPLKVAEMLKKFHEIPPDVDVIIRQHHEKPDGTGFPKGLSASYISPISCVFIISHELVKYLFLHGNNADVVAFFKEARAKYTTGNFKKIFEALENSGLSKLFDSKQVA